MPFQNCAVFFQNRVHTVTQKIHLTDTTTGEERVWTQDDDWYGDFIWSDGNYACDCNRHLFFQWAAGINTDVLDDSAPLVEMPCGHERYRVRITDEAGTLLYEDAE